MAQYLLSVHHDAGEDPFQTPIEEMQPVFEAVGRFNEELQNEGAWVFAGGLQHIDVTTTVDGTSEPPIVTDGPYAESKEWMGGFWVIEAADLDVALRWAARGSAACRRKVQVRPFQGE